MIVGVLLTLAVFVCVVGVGHKVIQYTLTPAPLKVPTTPAPTTRSGVVWRMLKEVVLFESLFKASKFTWVFGWLFHAGLLVTLLCHLRYFTEPVWGWVIWLTPFSRLAAQVMLAGLIGLLIRRVFVDRVRAISAPSDYLMLVHIILIGGSGFSMRYLAPADIYAVNQFALGLLKLEFLSLNNNFLLLLHLTLVAALLIIFPFSKLLHAPGLFFSPARYQVDNSREKRHVGKTATQQKPAERTDG